MNPLISITIVTYNSRLFIERCLTALSRLEYHPVEVIVVDNRSTDGTLDLLSQYEGSARIIRNPWNTGFAAGQNQAIEASRGEWVLTLNPDVRLEPDFLSSLLAAARPLDHVGVVCGKLLRAANDLSPLPGRRLDSTGIYFTPNMRHFDRGWNEPDDGRYDRQEYVFGACAAAALYRRAMIDDVAQYDGFFDPDFFAYREDADVAWRAQLLGWRCLYVPRAEAWHVRRLLPVKRRQEPALLRSHSVKNRFLMRAKNMTPGLYRRLWVPATLRDLAVAGACLVAEPGSLPNLPDFSRAIRRAIVKRREIQARRRVSDEYLAAWFQNEPASLPLEAIAEPVPRSREFSKRAALAAAFSKGRNSV